MVLLIYPEFAGDLRAFEEFRDHVRGSLRLFYCVAFHPALPMDLSDANRAVSFLRRSPDPTLQLVRIATLDRVRSAWVNAYSSATRKGDCTPSPWKPASSSTPTVARSSTTP